MTFALTLVLISVLGLLLLMKAARGRHKRIKHGGDPQEVRPVDIDAFRNLIDPAEEQFLREYLPPKDFRDIRRQRLLAALEYVRWSSHNAAILMRVGEAARFDRDPSIAESGQRLVNDAIRLRMFASLAMMKLCVGIALPGTDISAGSLVDHYQRVNGMARQLAVMRRPMHAGLANR